MDGGNGLAWFLRDVADMVPDDSPPYCYGDSSDLVNTVETSASATVIKVRSRSHGLTIITIVQVD